jgi:hypothetical protein
MNRRHSAASDVRRTEIQPAIAEFPLSRLRPCGNSFLKVTMSQNSPLVDLTILRPFRGLAHVGLVPTGLFGCAVTEHNKSNAIGADTGGHQAGLQ